MNPEATTWHLPTASRFPHWSRALPLARSSLLLPANTLTDTEENFDVLQTGTVTTADEEESIRSQLASAGLCREMTCKRTCEDAWSFGASG